VNDHDIAELSRVTTGNSALDASVLNTGLCGIVRRRLLPRLAGLQDLRKSQ